MGTRMLAIAAVIAAVLVAPAQAVGQGPTPQPPQIPAGWTLEYGGGEPHPANPWAWGSTSRRERRIWLRYQDTPGVLAHEAGHAWDAENMNVGERVAWTDRRGTNAWVTDPTDPGRRDFDWRRPDLPWGERPSEEFASSYRACLGYGWHGHHGDLTAPSFDDCEAMRRMLSRGRLSKP